jgi:phosphoglycolate phosphatase-like HAD superfamily hydrolase
MHVLLLDIDGTLLSSGGAGQAAMEAALEREFGAVRPIEGIAYAGRTDHAITRDLFDYYALEQTAERRLRFQQTYFELLPQYLSRREGLILPGVLELLELLTTRDDIAVGLLTGNFRHGAGLKLRHYAIDHHFTFGGYGDEHHDRDDVAREALRQAEAKVGRDAIDEVWVIGDTPADVRCARAIRAKVLAVATGHYTVPELEACAPDRVHATLERPRDWLPEILPPR